MHKGQTLGLRSSKDPLGRFDQLNSWTSLGQVESMKVGPAPPGSPGGSESRIDPFCYTDW